MHSCFKHPICKFNKLRSRVSLDLLNAEDMVWNVLSIMINQLHESTQDGYIGTSAVFHTLCMTPGDGRPGPSWRVIYFDGNLEAR